MGGEQRLVGNLPEMTTRMVGRRTELAEVLRWCAGPERLMTLTGVGGVGKTRLALEAADRLRPVFRDGVWLVELSPLREGDALPYAIAEQLPLADQSTRPMLDVLADYLSGRELLLILDTCEHLTDTGGPTVEALLRAAPGLRVLATSRRTLNVPGEAVRTIEPLSVPRPDDPAAARADAVVLLAERADRSVPGLALDEAGRGELAALARRLEGLPLAIELAAARLGDMSVRELIDRLDDRFAILGESDALVRGIEPPWHQALRTTIGWSHQLCRPAERLLWARLSVFAGTFDTEAVRAVCADRHLPGPLLPGLLAELVDKSIVTWQPTAGGDRYRMLDTLREFGADWLRHLGEEEELRRRHGLHYRALAVRADVAWMSPEQIAWHERTDADHANYRAALDFCLGEGNDGGAALELAGALWFRWLACGLQHEGRHYLERALRRSPAPSAARSKAVWACGAIALGQGDLDTVAVMARELRPAAEAAADPAMLVAAAHLDGGFLGLSGQPARAAAVFDAAPYTRDHGAAYSGARFLVWTIRVFAHTNLGEFAQAVAAADAMRTQCLDCGDRWARAFADYVGGLAALGLGRLDEAAAYGRASLEAKSLLRDSIGIGTSIDLLASITAATGQGRRAARLLGIGQQTWNAIGRDQLGVPELIAARQDCERRARETAGDTAYETAFRKGLEDSLDDGLVYALHDT
ncbi:AAA family ATPase [Streptomyces sp. Q6]|uniref:AAA family ATPase n=1 Tax=Streptomyces citrinus TaxID=3118173 RepID=A0ACD5A4J3_9ACTN